MSSGLNQVACAAWQELAVATNITKWGYCSRTLLDPCSCGNITNPYPYGISVSCVNGDITDVVLAMNNVAGTIPSSLALLTKLNRLDLRWNA